MMYHEEIERVYKNHVLTSLRDVGEVRKLTGNIDVIVFFVNDSRSIWTDSAKQKYRAMHKEAMQYLLHTARDRGVRLQIRNAYVDASVSMDCHRDRYEQWSKVILGKYGAEDIPSYQRRHKAKMGCAEVPILFVFNKPFISCAVYADRAAPGVGEMSILSGPECSPFTIVHELLHQFGAVDLYYPEPLRTLVQRMGYKSVMASGRDMDIDSLTAYLIGWTEAISDGAAKLLEKTAYLTRESWADAARDQHVRRTK